MLPAGLLIDANLRWVVYVPSKLPESTGLSTTSGPGPWLMYPGTAVSTQHHDQLLQEQPLFYKF